jgi:short-subunit dehydrogenase
MLEKNARQSLDHMRGMTSEEVAEATLDALAAGRKTVNLTFQGKALLFAARFMPGLVDRISKKKVRELFADEIAARRKAG